MKKLKYTVEDKTIAFLLGVNNFINDETAVLELVKNAYDAGSTELHIIFADDSITFVDNGIGMNMSDIEKHWMCVGDSNKGYSITDKNNNDRVVAGAKGVGRFALARLGRTVELYSLKEGDTGIVWKTDWEKSTVDEINYDNPGTKIVIKDLNERWSKKRIEQLDLFLSKAYTDTCMKITTEYDGYVEVVYNSFCDAKVGINCLSKINIDYSANKGTINVKIVSDEFLEEAKKWCEGIDISQHECVLYAQSEVETNEFKGIDETDLDIVLKELGDFSSELFFSNKPTSKDAEKFLYKHSAFQTNIEKGVILYRNAFCITPYDGSRDWLELAKRVRKSPAVATHETGAWRVRDNQLSGFVRIDKEENKSLIDLSNRQGLEENLYYEVFLAIIHAGLSEFERYRQSIIRKINQKNKETVIESALTELVLSGKKKIENLLPKERKQLIEEIKTYKNESIEAKKEQGSTESKYKYDVRILNVLATIGLKSSSIAHEIKNGKSAIENNIQFAIEALQEYGMWDTLHSPEYTKREYMNVPNLLQNYNKHNKRMVSFVDTMLSEIEKKQFEVKTLEIANELNIITDRWEKEYSWVIFNLKIPSNMVFNTSQDILQVIFDNLILNSIQQNENRRVQIGINIAEQEGCLFIEYCDDGKGLDKKYKDNPRRILEVHETTRRNGHGLGMWMVNNTVVMTGGEVVDILGNQGFFIRFKIGERL